MVDTGRDPMFPDAPLVVVVSLLHAKFGDSGDGESRGHSRSSSRRTSLVGNAPEIRELSGSSGRRTSLTGETPELGVIVLDEPVTVSEKSETEPEMEQEQEPEMDPEEAERIRRMDKIRRLGGVAGAFAMPIPPMPKARRPSETADIPRARQEDEVALQKTAMSQYPDRRYQAVPGLSAALSAPSGSPSKSAHTNDPNKSPFDNMFDNLERSIETKLDSMTGAGTEAGEVVSGVTSLVAYVRAKQQEVDRLKAELERERSAASRQVSVQSLETVKREGERIQKATADLEKNLVEVDAKVRELESTLQSSGSSSIQREKTLMKRLMSKVFDEVQTIFEEKKLYSGEQVGDLLKKLMREQSFSIIKDIEENGLF